MPDNESSQKRLTHKPIIESEELLFLIEENVEDYAMIVLDTNGCIINWNKGADGIFGYALDTIWGKDTSFLFTPEDRDNRVPEQELNIALEKGRAQDDRWHIRKDGTRFWASGILTALRKDDGTLRGFVKILRDFTERKNLEDTLREERERADEARREVEKLNAVLRRAMTEAHHRIKNSFQLLSALLDLQVGRREENASSDDYKKISLQIRALASIHDLLTEEAKSGAEFDVVNVKNSLAKLLPLLADMTPSRTLTTHVADVLLPIKQGACLSLLVSELVSNAIKHGAGEVTVALTHEGEAACLKVCDAGPGFPASFDLKQSAHTGLELIESLTHHDLRGQSFYENKPAGGAQIRIVFPLPSLNTHHRTPIIEDPRIKDYPKGDNKILPQGDIAY